ncbi:MAG: hypothetical protein AB2536_14175 [Candidatus Thiodiazotropha endolucinida]
MDHLPGVWQEDYSLSQTLQECTPTWLKNAADVVARYTHLDDLECAMTAKDG